MIFDIFGVERKKLKFQLADSLVEREVLCSKLDFMEQERVNLLQNLENLQAQLDSKEIEEEKLFGAITGWQAALKKSQDDALNLSSDIASMSQDYQESKLKWELQKNRYETEINKILFELSSEREKIVEVSELNSQLSQEISMLIERIGSISSISEKNNENFDVDKRLLCMRVDQAEQDLIDSQVLFEDQLSQMTTELYSCKKERNQALFNCAKLNSRINAIQLAYPDHIDFSHVDIVSVQEKGNANAILFRAVKTYRGGVDYPELIFQTFINNGVLGISLKTDSPGDSCTLHPKDIKVGSSNFAHFRNISAKDWCGMQCSIAVLKKIIQKKWRGVTLPRNFDPNFWQDVIENLIRDFDRLPRVLRYSTVSFLGETKNPDYENLWLKIEDIQFGSRNFPSVEMRVSAALVNEESFSLHPKFEFPLINGDKPFASWYEESTDSFGPKFELRFSLADEAIDINALNKLDPEDRDLVINLIILAPQFLSTLMEQGVSISRPWITWLGLENNATGLVKKIFKAKKGS